jgi:signal peptidase I
MGPVAQEPEQEIGADPPAPAEDGSTERAPDTAPTVVVAGSRPTKRRRPWYRDLPILIVVAVVLALFIKTFFVQAFYIPSESMHDTLIENDRVLVDRLVYRFHEPRRGDVIVFRNPHPPPSSGNPFSALLDWLGQGVGISQGGRNKDFIKRVIGLPGDTVEMNRGVVYVNGTPLREPYVSKTNVDFGQYGPYNVPPDSLFVMGDNRTHSDDSRGSLRFIPLDKVVGRAFVIIWPPSRWRGIHPVSYGRVSPP